MLKYILFSLTLILSSGSAFAQDMTSKIPVGEDGLYKPSWLYETTMDISKDFINAQQRDKILVYLFEQPGCVYCYYMHEDVFIQENIKNLLIDNFYVIQLQMNGMIPLKDFNGKEYPERNFSQLNKIIGTPSMVFFDSKKPISSFDSVLESHIMTIPGAFKPEQFYDILVSIVSPEK